jgi:glyoxylase-like metal-dependent hydrolase (beta-lactamase superfamily II)
MIHEILVVGLLQCNCSILGCEETREAMVVDPGDDPERILKVVNRLGLQLKYILHTHAHFDHVGGSQKLKEATGARIFLHPADLFLYEKVEMQTAYFGLPAPEMAPVDVYMSDGQEVAAGSLLARILHTPGHTPGSVCFHMEEGPGKLFTGDTLFKDSIGRTDLWGGSQESILASIGEKLFELPDETVVYPGHGPATTIGREKELNPFLQ